MVDDDDFENLSSVKWSLHKGPASRTKYAIRKKKTILPNGALFWKGESMHRVVLGAVKGQVVDHIDGNGLNNQKANLRFATNQQNQHNRKKYTTNTSGYKGVSVAGRNVSKPWRADLALDGKNVYCGIFTTKEEAALAYNLKAIELHGEFANLNVIPNA